MFKLFMAIKGDDSTIEMVSLDSEEEISKHVEKYFNNHDISVPVWMDGKVLLQLHDKNEGKYYDINPFLILFEPVVVKTKYKLEPNGQYYNSVQNT